MPEVTHAYGGHFARARLKAAETLGKPDLRTVTGAARYLGLGKSTLYHYEDGTRRPSLEHLELMAKGYGCLVGDLLPCSSLRSEEIAPIIAPLMAIPEGSRNAFITRMAALAETLAGAVDDARVSVTATYTKGVISATPVTPTSTAPSEQSDKLEIIPVPAPAPERDPDGRETRRHDNAKTGRKRTG